MVSRVKINDKIVLSAASPGPVARLHLDTDPYDSPLPSQRSILRRDSHILAEISELESNFANQEQVNTVASQDLDDVVESIERAIAEISQDDNSNTSEIAAETLAVVNDTSDSSEPTEAERTKNIGLVKLFDDAEQSFNLRFDLSIFIVTLLSLIGVPGPGFICLSSHMFVCPVFLTLSILSSGRGQDLLDVPHRGGIPHPRSV